MCGLIGCAGPNAGTVLDRDRSLALIAHRGPDGQGWAPGAGYVLGHTRLAIQDLQTRSNQPWAVGNVTLTYNGELWNADEIHVGPRTTTGDTEIVAKALELYGEAALPRLDGMWAIAWHDRQAGRVTLSRDRWGKVPLYYGTDGVRIYWASEYKALPRGVVGQAVEPGGLVRINVDDGSIDLDRWALVDPLLDLECNPETVLALLRQGVKERLVGDRSIALMLSGGLDSTLILALARELTPVPLTAYTAVGDPDSEDLKAARHMARHFDVELVEVPVPAVTPASIDEAVRAVEIPMKAQVEIALAHLPVMAQIAADGHAVCLSGEAADELFGGYGGMQIKASATNDDGYRKIKLAAVEKMARGNFSRVNKVGMFHGVECRLPFMQTQLVDLALAASKVESPPGKKVLKAAAKGIVPDRVIRRPKQTFQGGVGTGSAATDGRLKVYNELARTHLGYLPKT